MTIAIQAIVNNRNNDSVAHVRELLCANRRITVREISAEGGITYSAREVSLTEFLNMRCVSAKFAPRVLTIERKNAVCRN
jgi:hypothetical protein